MHYNRRKIAFVVASSDHGTMIVNRFDYRMVDKDKAIGVGLQILEKSSFDSEEVDLALHLLDVRRKYFGDGVMAIDCGANIGVHTIEWAKKTTGWGSVIAIEAQERVYYALAGNIAINNCFNARALHAAVAATSGSMKIPNPNYLAAGSFGSLELRKSARNEFIGQKVDYSEQSLVEVRSIALDSLNLERIDFIKIDVEGMELEALEGAAASIKKARPILIIESVKSDKAKLRSWLQNLNYQVYTMGMNYLAIHESDPSRAHVKVAEPKPAA